MSNELVHLPKNEQIELHALHLLSNEALCVIAAEQMSPVNQAQMGQLMARNNKGTLRQEEQDMLAALVERGDQLMLRKAEAPAILAQRLAD